MYGTILRRFSEIGLPQKSVILTFDDGPNDQGITVELLDLLAELRVTAAFCLVSQRIQGAECIVCRIDEDGHLLVNHGHEHKVPNIMTDDQWRADVEEWNRTTRAALKKDNWRSEWYRPPGGSWNRRVSRFIHAQRLSLMPITFFAWDTVPFPYRQKFTLWLMLRNLRKQQGGVFLLHEDVLPLLGGVGKKRKTANRRWILPVVRQFVTQARSEGYSFVNPRELCDLQ